MSKGATMCMKWQGLGAAIGTAIATLVGNVFLMNRYYYKHIGLNTVSYTHLDVYKRQVWTHYVWRF